MNCNNINSNEYKLKRLTPSYEKWHLFLMHTSSVCVIWIFVVLLIKAQTTIDINMLRFVQNQQQCSNKLMNEWSNSIKIIKH